MTRSARSAVRLRGDLHVHPPHRGCDHVEGFPLGGNSQCIDAGVRAAQSLVRRAGLEYAALVSHASDSRRPHLTGTETAGRLFALLKACLRTQTGRGPVLFAGVETTLLADGHVDVVPAVLSHMDLVLVAAHGGHRRPTARILHAFLQVMGNHRVDVVAPQSAGVTLRESDWERLVDRAAATQTALAWTPEHAPSTRLAKLVAASGAFVALGSDRHEPDVDAQLLFSHRNLHARLLTERFRDAGVPARRILNTLTAPQLIRWLTRRYEA